MNDLDRYLANRASGADHRDPDTLAEQLMEQHGRAKCRRLAAALYRLTSDRR